MPWWWLDPWDQSGYDKSITPEKNSKNPDSFWKKDVVEERLCKPNDKSIYIDWS